MASFIIGGYVWQILRRGRAFYLPQKSVISPKSPILNSVKINRLSVRAQLSVFRFFMFSCIFAEIERRNVLLSMSNTQKQSIARRFSVKKMFLKILQNLRRKTSVLESLFLLKLNVSDLQLYRKRDSGQVFSCEFCEILKNTFFYRAPPVAVFSHLFSHKDLLLNWYTMSFNHITHGCHSFDKRFTYLTLIVCCIYIDFDFFAWKVASQESWILWSILIQGGFSFHSYCLL